MKKVVLLLALLGTFTASASADYTVTWPVWHEMDYVVGTHQEVLRIREAINELYCAEIAISYPNDPCAVGIDNSGGFLGFGMQIEGDIDCMPAYNRSDKAGPYYGQSIVIDDDDTNGIGGHDVLVEVPAAEDLVAEADLPAVCKQWIEENYCPIAYQEYWPGACDFDGTCCPLE